jgi:hypothetical protein
MNTCDEKSSSRQKPGPAPAGPLGFLGWRLAFQLQALNLLHHHNISHVLDISVGAANALMRGQAHATPHNLELAARLAAICNLPASDVTLFELPAVSIAQQIEDLRRLADIDEPIARGWAVSEIAKLEQQEGAAR